MRTVVINADYDEFKPETLRGFDVIQYDGIRVVETETFPSLESAAKRAGELATTFMYLSSVDNFIADMRHVRPN